MAEVILESVCKRYLASGDLAVRDLSLQVRDGEFITLVGPSGCGKSTVLRLVAGLEPLTSGAIHIGGHRVNEAPPHARGVAMVFQDSSLYPHMTGYENLAFALRTRRVPRDEIDRRVREAASILAISGLLQRKPASLSGGERQRFALGRALAIAPDVSCLLFDEPLSDLDAAQRTVLRSEIKSLHERMKTTTVHVTHDQEEAMTLGDRVAVMAAGTLQQVASPLEIYRQPRNRFVAGFIGSPAMNFIDGAIVRHGGELAFAESAEEGLRLELPRRLFGRIAAQEGDRVVLGVRAEDLVLARDGGVHFATVRFVELLGDRMNVHAVTRSRRDVVIRTRAIESVRAGAAITFDIRAEGLRLFAPGEFGESLALETGSARE